jgi:hypothetical protein
MTKNHPEWVAVVWGKRPGWARRTVHQPFSWTTLYQFIADDDPSDRGPCLLSGEVLNLGIQKPTRRERALAKRGGLYFHATWKGRRGVACVHPDSPVSCRTWNLLLDTGEFHRVPDTALEVFQNWGHEAAWNVWKTRVEEDARKSRFRSAMRRGQAYRSNPSPAEKKSLSHKAFSAGFSR